MVVISKYKAWLRQILSFYNFYPQHLSDKPVYKNCTVSMYFETAYYLRESHINSYWIEIYFKNIPGRIFDFLHFLFAVRVNKRMI